MSVFALSSDNQWDSLTFGVVMLMCLLGEGKIIWGLKSSSYQKCCMCSKIWGRPDQLSSGISGMHDPKHFLVVFFGTPQLINS